jgi:hypothetical protein
MDIHGKVAEIGLSNLGIKQNTLITIRAEGEDNPHAFYLEPAQMLELYTQLKHIPFYVASTIQHRFWDKVG